jgi:micrococcal nuclease
MPRRRSLIALLLAVAIGAVLGSGALPVSGDGEEAGTARVVRVVDGDTIAVRLDGRQERVRYIGVDTPETKKPGSPVECYGKRASAENERLVEGEEVRLVADAEARDRYGRMLAYVYRVDDGRFVNAELVRGGFAQPLTIPPNVAHADEFAALARAARRQGRGLWGACAT